MTKVLARQLAHSKLYPAFLAFSLLASPSAQAGSELNQRETATFRTAIADASRGRGQEAVRAVRRTESDIGRDVVQWYALQTGSIDANFAAYANFIKDHADWPRCIEIDSKLQCDMLRRQAELRVSAYDSPAAVIDLFSTNPPLTARGLRAYAAALDKTGQHDSAENAIRSFWINGAMTLDRRNRINEQRDYLEEFGHILKEADREARVDRLLWDGATESAKDLIPSLNSAGYKAVANARIALQNDEGNVATLVNAVPASHAGDPGLAFDRARRLAQKDNEEAAARLLIAHGPATNGKASAWWKLRERVARELVAQGEADDAYKVASQHGVSPRDDQSYRDAEWTSGWIALRFVGNAEKATQHFRNMYNASTSIISQARGAYWTARAEQALNHGDEAKQWYEKSARFSTTYYGQLAAHELYGDVNVRPPSTPEPDAATRAVFANRDMARAVRIGVEINNHSVAKAFMNALADASRSQSDATLTVELGAELHRPDLAAWAAKRVGRLGYDVPAEGYPALNFPLPSAPEKPLILGITRQESTFYTQAKSGANAQGLMQLLPATAAKQARDLGIQHQEQWLLSKPEHNVRLGSAYLSGRINGFGSYIWGIAAYNGGPGNAARWSDRYGSSGRLAIRSAARQGEPALWSEIDRVELISFAETREYVQRVLEQTEVYRAILSRGQPPALLQLQRNLTYHRD